MPLIFAFLMLLPGQVLAASSAPPESLTDEAALWYAAASVAMLVALAAAGWLVGRR